MPECRRLAVDRERKIAAAAAEAWDGNRHRPLPERRCFEELSSVGRRGTQHGRTSGSNAVRSPRQFIFTWKVRRVGVIGIVEDIKDDISADVPSFYRDQLNCTGPYLRIG